MAECALCGMAAVTNRQDNGSRTIYNCSVCGVFVISDMVMAEVQRDSHKIAAFMAARKLRDLPDTVLISYEKANLDKEYLQLTVAQIADRFPLSFSEGMELALLNLAALSAFPGAEYKVESLDPWPYFYLLKADYDALSYMIRAMQKAELVDVNHYSPAFFPCGIVMSPLGWDRVAARQNARPTGKEALLVSPRSEEVWGVALRQSARKAAEDNGYRVSESGSASPDDRVGHAMIAQIRQSGLVICDLSEDSGCGYYCAGLALALGKPTVLTCHKSHLGGLKIAAGEMSVLVWSDKKDLYHRLSNLIQASVM